LIYKYSIFLMSWTQNETEQYLLDLSNNVGRMINTSQCFHICAFAKNTQLKTFLEIGTWNGMGSTKTFLNAFNDRFNDNSYSFYSLECNKEKCENAAKLYIDNPNVHILNEVLWNEVPSNFYDLFPECLNNEDIKAQFDVDMDNMKKCNLFLERPELPEIFDFVLLDGGDCTTYFDFQAIKDRSMYIFITDINNIKGKQIITEISNNKNWRCIFHSKNDSFVLIENINITRKQRSFSS